MAGLEYDYFFEVDGARKYDFDLDFRTVDLFNYSLPSVAGSGFGQTGVSVGGADEKKVAH